MLSNHLLNGIETVNVAWSRLPSAEEDGDDDGAEYEEVVRRYESLNKDNTNLKSEMNKLKEDMEKLRLENATLMEKLESTQPRQPGEVDPNDPNVKLEDSCNKK
nr:G-box-binding factor 3-like isoform X2 [Ipomoea batatas]